MTDKRKKLQRKMMGVKRMIADSETGKTKEYDPDELIAKVVRHDKADEKKR